MHHLLKHCWKNQENIAPQENMQFKNSKHTNAHCPLLPRKLSTFQYSHCAGCAQHGVLATSIDFCPLSRRNRLIDIVIRSAMEDNGIIDRLGERTEELFKEFLEE